MTSRTPFIASAATGFMAVLCGCGLGSERGYTGDGTLIVLHRLPVTAMKIDFPEFQLDQPFQAKYRVVGLPRSNYGYAIGLAVNLPINHFLPPDTGWPGSEGLLHLRLLDEANRPIVDCNGELFRFNWHSIEGDTPFATARAPSEVSRGVECNSEFYLSGSQVPAAVEVTYKPEPRSPGATACIRIVSVYSH
jgi:hypothetical protein